MRIYYIQPGDIVKIKRTPKKEFQGHGGWVSDITATFGKTGSVQRFDSNTNTFTVYIDDTGDSWFYPMSALKLLAAQDQ